MDYIYLLPVNDGLERIWDNGCTAKRRKKYGIFSY